MRKLLSKKKWIEILILLLTMLLSGMSYGFKGEASETSSQVTFSYTDWNKLSQKQQELVVKGVPDQFARNDQEHYSFIYQKNNENATILPTDLSFKETTSAVQNLPKTSDKESPKLLLVVGFGILITVSLIVYWKRKTFREMMLLLVIVGTAGTFFGRNVKAAEIQLRLDTKVTINKGDSVYRKPDDIQGFTYVGYIYSYSNDTSPLIEDGQITVGYQDDQGNALLDDIILTGKVGETYTTEQKNIQNYTFKEVKGNTSGSYSSEIQSVTYIYTKNPVKGGSVIVKFVDSQDNSISDDIVLSGNIGESYSTVQKEFEGYRFKQVIGNQSGNFTKDETIIKYQYIRQGEVEFKVNSTDTFTIGVRHWGTDINGKNDQFLAKRFVLYNHPEIEIKDSTVIGDIGSNISFPYSQDEPIGMISVDENGNEVLVSPWGYDQIYYSIENDIIDSAEFTDQKQVIKVSSYMAA